LKSASPVSNVSDTARWVAVYRAWESARPDALFDDPYAQSLAGERGQAIAALMASTGAQRLADDCAYKAH
jgi:O-methyltransferase involved in polyketide biosynthesis